jgi:iron complex outermembrane receptor protein
VYVNDRNTDAAPAYTVCNVRVGFEQRSGRWVLREFARLNNIANVNYSGTVIVGDANGRYFEPSATRNFLVGVSASATY